MMKFTSTYYLTVAAVFTFLLIKVKGAEFRVATIYSSNMVLQMEPKHNQIWGYGDPGGHLLLSISNSDNEFIGVYKDHKWFVHLPPQPPGGPHEIKITHTSSEGSTETYVLFDIMFGDVWVCFGGDNMQFSMSQIVNSTEEIKKATEYDKIRIMQAGRFDSPGVPMDQVPWVDIPWSKPSSDLLPSFSALCMLYGEQLSDLLIDRPIGVIDATWAGTPIESWSSATVIYSCGTPASEGFDQYSNTALWNGMINPITKMAVRGAIMYQGETNAAYNADLYPCHLQSIVDNWRDSFYNGSVAAENGIAFPFGIVQLGPNEHANPEEWGRLRWHQTLDNGSLPNVRLPEAFMASAYDLTDEGSPSRDIHPRDKQTIAIRLANAAKNLLYGESHLMQGPIVDTLDRDIVNDSFILTYNIDIQTKGTDGFSYRELGGEWLNINEMSMVDPRTVTLKVPPSANELAYAWSGSVCKYKQCAVYSIEDDLPAQAWIWKLIERP